MAHFVLHVILITGFCLAKTSAETCFRRNTIFVDSSGPQNADDVYYGFFCCGYCTDQHTPLATCNDGNDNYYSKSYYACNSGLNTLQIAAIAISSLTGFAIIVVALIILYRVFYLKRRRNHSSGTNNPGTELSTMVVMPTTLTAPYLGNTHIQNCATNQPASSQPTVPASTYRPPEQLYVNLSGK